MTFKMSTTNTYMDTRLKLWVVRHEFHIPKDIQKRSELGHSTLSGTIVTVPVRATPFSSHSI